MRRAFFVLLVALVAASLLVLASRGQPGYALFVLGDYTLETTAWGLGALLLALAALVYGARCLVRLARRGGGLSLFTPRNGTTRGLIKLMEGDWKRARRLLIASASRSHAPLINYISAARASHALGDTEQMEHLLREAIATTPGADLAVGLAKAELQYAAGQYEPCLATLLRLRELKPRHPGVLTLLANTYRQLRDWPPLAALLPQLRKSGALPEADCQALEHLAYGGLLAAAPDAATLQNRWMELPKAARKQPVLVAEYARALIGHGAAALAEDTVRQALRHQWDDELAGVYGLTRADDAGKQLKQLDQWLQEHGNSVGLLRSAGQFHAAQRDYGKARDYLDAALRREPDTATALTLARLYGAAGDSQRALALLERTVGAGDAKGQAGNP